MKISTTLTLDIQDESIRETTVKIDYLECSLCHRHIPREKSAISAREQIGKRQLWLCPTHTTTTMEEGDLC